jgi:hypothetical protein
MLSSGSFGDRGIYTIRRGRAGQGAEAWIQGPHTVNRQAEVDATG